MGSMETLCIGALRAVETRRVRQSHTRVHVVSRKALSEQLRSP